MCASLMMQPSAMIERSIWLLMILVAGQVARVGEDRRGGVVEVELRQRLAEVEVGLEEGPDGPDVLPVALVLEGVDPAGLDQRGMMCLPKSTSLLGQRVVEHVAVEDVDPHRGGEPSSGASLAQRPACTAGSRRLLHEADDPSARPPPP